MFDFVALSDHSDHHFLSNNLPNHALIITKCLLNSHCRRNFQNTRTVNIKLFKRVDQVQDQKKKKSREELLNRINSTEKLFIFKLCLHLPLIRRQTQP